MKKYIEEIICILIFVGFFWFIYYLSSSEKQYCIENPVECAVKKEKSRKYFEDQRKKEQNISCGLTMPGLDPGFGGYKCEFDD